MNAYRDSGNSTGRRLPGTHGTSVQPRSAAGLRGAAPCAKHQFSLAIDDFGVEYASMTNLLNVPVDWMKIDRSFIAQIHDNERVQRLVRSQIAVASIMQLNLIAEGSRIRNRRTGSLEAGAFCTRIPVRIPTETSDLAALVDGPRSVGAATVRLPTGLTDPEPERAFGATRSARTRTRRPSPTPRTVAR